MRRRTPTAAAAVLVTATVALIGCSGHTEVLAARSSSGSVTSSLAAGSFGTGAGTQGSAGPPSGVPGQPEAGTPPHSTPAPDDPGGPAVSGAPPESADQQNDEPAGTEPQTAAGLPQGWPAQVQLPPGAEVFADPDAGIGRELAFRAPGSPADLGAFFFAELTAAGFTRTDESTAPGASTATYLREGSTVELTLVEGDGASVGTVTIGP